MEISLGFSTCPNDTFIFDALVNKRIDTKGIDFKVILSDVEDLNNMAFHEKLDVTKISYHALALLLDKYALCYAGSALGFNCGPLLVFKKGNNITDISKKKVAIPGKYTTANFLLSLAYPALNDKVEMVFSDIEEAVLSGKVDAGLLIHENRFTYKERGLDKLTDLGEFWQDLTNGPIPLGGIAVKKSIAKELQLTINDLIEESVKYAFQNPDASKEYIKMYAQEMDETVIRQHIELYVNKYSIRLMGEGLTAVETLFKKAKEAGIISNINQKIFVGE